DGSTGLVTKYPDPVGTVMKTSYTTVNSKSAYPDKITRDQGDGKLNLITDYDYDAKGNVTAVTDAHGVGPCVHDLLLRPARSGDQGHGPGWQRGPHGAQREALEDQGDPGVRCHGP